MNQRLFITGTGTGIGKSFITAALARQARAASRGVMAYKPVISGFNDANIADSDTGLLLQSLDLPATPENIERLSPWRYTAPLAPSMAARTEKRPLDFKALIAHGHAAMEGKEDVVLIEGVGGLMVPLTEHQTVLEWIEALEIEVLLVAGTYLGALSHALTALEVLIQHKIPVFAVVVNESEPSSVSLPDTLDELARWTRLPLIPVARREDGNWREIKELRPLVT